MFRFGCVAGGASLYAPQAQNNIIRVAYEAMASALGGVQSMFTAAWDEPFALPSEESTTLALRTQQILAYETGVARVADPLGGSYFVEALTDATEERIKAIMDDLDARGGMVRAIEDGYLQGLIADEAYRAHQGIESGEKPVVGVNSFTEPTSRAPDLATYELDPDGRDRQLQRLAQVKAEPRPGRRPAPPSPRWPRRPRRKTSTSCTRSSTAPTPTARSARWSPRSRTSGASSSSRWCSEPCPPGSSSPSPASTATTAAPRSSPARCATPASRSSSPASARDRGHRRHRRPGGRRHRRPVHPVRRPRRAHREGRSPACERPAPTTSPSSSAARSPPRDVPRLRAAGGAGRLPDRHPAGPGRRTRSGPRNSTP